MRLKYCFVSIAAAGGLAAALLAACSGGGHTSPAPVATVGGTAETGSITFTVGGPGTQAAKRNGQTIPAASAQSLVIAYLGDASPGTAPTNPFAIPPAAPRVSFSGVPYVNLSTATNCNAIGSGSTATLSCTIAGITLPVGTIDLYFIVYDQTGGTGNMIYGSVSPISVSTTGALTNPITQAGTNSFSLTGNYSLPGVTVGFNQLSVTVAPNAAPIANSSPYPLSPAFSVYANDANGIKASGALTPIIVSINDTTSAACLEYAPASSPAPTATPCAFAVIGSTPQPVTATNTNDQIYVQYNNKPASLTGGVGPWTVTAAIASPQASATAASTSMPVIFSPGAFVASPTLPTGSAGYQGTLLNISGTIYAASSTSALAPSSAIAALTMTSGALSTATTSLPSTLTTSIDALITSTSGTTPVAAPMSASALQGTVAAMTQGPDNNLWFAENTATGIAIGVYVPPGGNALSGVVSQNAVAESINIPAESGTTSGITSGAVVTGMTSFNSYVWVTDSKGDIMRISPSNFGGTIGNDTLATGIIILLGGATTTTSTLAPSNGFGLAADSAPSPLPGLISNGIQLVYPGGTGSVVGVTPLSAPTSTAGGSFLTGTASTDIKSTTPGTFSETNGGLILATDGNIWTNSTTQFLNTNLTKTNAFTSVLINLSGGGIAQSSLDKFVFTLLSSGNALAYSTLDGSFQSFISLGISSGTCTGLSPATSGGEGLLNVSNYFIWASSTKFCIIIE